MVPNNILLIHAFIFGVQLSIIYNVNQVLRELHRHRIGEEYLEDLIFWMIAFGAALLFLYRENHGEIRGFLVIGAIAGVICYECLCKNISTRIWAGIARIMLRVWKMCWRIVRLPIIFIFFPLIFMKRWLKNTKEVYKMGVESFRNRGRTDAEQEKEKSCIS